MKKSDVLDQCDISLASLVAHLDILRNKTKAPFQVGRVDKAIKELITVKGRINEFRVNDTGGA